MQLTGKQKRYLRSQANTLSPIFSIGKAGASAEWLAEVKKALAKRELVKVNVQQGSEWSAKDLAAFIEKESTITVAQVIGKTVLLYEEAKDAKYVKYSLEINKLA
ncbi:ribosome assembly RNA-binding protein YhbY [Fructobacillus sp. M1-13]|uniref:Ribosome assembly RNA-binding protein YhbY n=1 Tax=Fructobacillus papyriferae TaxID=2713171 RepID=A0ABS5QQE8_9LACO|nr:ribosome assembly RNA-binding protein YhbY [Fructobacillus papyriferae]MBS9335413.1 ribosome assembly RNA-binding protein YhbY [Fructobacillus papyriferae]MCD2158917.1 ribosome assembly RNA-binding protein YhbY [Fructobacillus papyriferae]